MTDPFLGKAPAKVYRYDGIVPNDSSYPELIVQDPRTFKSKTKSIILPIDLPVPKFKVCISFQINFFLPNHRHLIENTQINSLKRIRKL